jgi:hypothetical protein
MAGIVDRVDMGLHYIITAYGVLEVLWKTMSSMKKENQYDHG